MRFPLVPPPLDIQFTLDLIKEELKSRKFFNTLQKMGLGNSPFQPHLGALILRTLNMDPDAEVTFNTYYRIIERRSKKIRAQGHSVAKQALKVYHELVAERERRLGGHERA
ncbi:MAG TPA: hypothetical protein VIU12_34525 [Chryseolinea sp.]